jgi:hypothetical protein
VTVEEIAFTLFLCLLSGYAGYLIAYYQAAKVIVETLKEALEGKRRNESVED